MALDMKQVLTYRYEEQRAWVFTADGQRALFELRDWVRATLSAAGAFRADVAWERSGMSGDTWQQLAALDYLCELGQIWEVTGPDVPGQRRVFTRVRG